ncbi:hypothetical protein J3A83DRAFT_4373282 [Scleroderma citrinum]
MPPIRPPPYHSTQLQALVQQPSKPTIMLITSNASKLHPKSTMTPQSSGGRGNLCGRPKGKRCQQSTVLQSNTFELIPQPPAAPPPSQGVTSKSLHKISWDADPTCSEKLVAWLVSHPADCHILFHDHTGNSSTTSALFTNDKPSGRNKKDVQAAIAKHIFKHDIKIL